MRSCVNLSEVLQKAEQHDVDTGGLEYDLQALGVDFRAFDLPDARATAGAMGGGNQLVARRSCVPRARRDGRWNGGDDRARMDRSSARRLGRRDPVTTDPGRPQLCLRTHFAGTIPWCVRKS
jgi:hypothetical protein